MVYGLSIIPSSLIEKLILASDKINNTNLTEPFTIG